MNRNPASSVPAAPSKHHVPPQWAWHHRTLLALHRRLVAETKEHRQGSAVAAFTEPTELVDTVSDKLEHDLLLAELKREENTLAEVEAALQRIHNGIYGICEATGKTIPDDRLRALPWTRVVREVAAQQEHSRSTDHPPQR